MLYPVTKQTLEQVLTTRINKAEAELRAFKAVAINNKHKTLTNRSVWSEVEGVGVRIGDYIGLGKALYVGYTVDHRYVSIDIIAFTYQNPDGSEIGTDGTRRISRTMTPAELQNELDKIIEGRKQSLNELKIDLVNAASIVKRYNKIATDMEKLNDSVTWATREVIR